MHLKKLDLFLNNITARGIFSICLGKNKVNVNNVEKINKENEEEDGRRKREDK